MSAKKQVTREEWLVLATDLLRPIFKARGYTIPKKVRVSIGWPLGRRTAIGQCFGDHMSGDGTHELFISPELDDPLRILDVLVHELLHASVGVANQHNAIFAKAARLLDLGGKPTATVATDEFKVWGKKLLKQLPKFRHAVLAGKRPHKKQGTRMIKCECSTCGYVARTTRKWLDEAGAPICPTDEIQMDVEEK